MARLLSWILVPTLAVASLVGGQTALAQKKTDPAHTVQDDAAFFSPEAKDRANQTIRQIKQQFNKDFFVETQPKAPESAQDAASFAKWAEGRAKNQNVNGVHVVLTKEPTRFQVSVGSKTRDLGYFTAKDRDELAKLMLAKLKAKKNDEALTDGAVFVLETMRKHKSAAAVPAADKGQQVARENRAPAQAGGGEINWGKWIMIGLAVLLGVWVISALIRAFSGGGGQPGMAGGGYGGGGGGFFSSLLGGLFGAAAGMWLYNSFFGGNTSSAYGGESSGSSASSEPTDVGGDYSSSGGDYSSGDAGGGGDWGGGGGDWGGGGDFGGGGGDFGGGE